MRRTHKVIGIFLLVFSLAYAYTSDAQDAPRKNEENKTSVEGRAGDTNFDIRVQNQERNQDRAQRAPERREGPQGSPGPAGEPGPRGPAGPTGPAGGEVMGMDPTIALLVGLGVLAVVIVAIVAASRGRE